MLISCGNKGGELLTQRPSRGVVKRRLFIMFILRVVVGALANSASAEVVEGAIP